QWPPWPLQFTWKWPWQDGERERKRLKEECERRRAQVETLCKTVKADTLAELQELLGAMVLSECVYKKPDHDVVRAVNKFKADFGGQLVSLDGVQASLDHVPHRYLLAEGKDTLYASFVGTNHYKDVIADANVLQGAIFHEEDLASLTGDEEANEAEPVVKGLGADASPLVKQQKFSPKPAAHKGFLGRAKGIPAVEIYRLAQEKDKKLVLCGHSLGGAVAVLTTLAILRVFSSRNGGKLNVKCITFSQPPVGNRALRDYVHRSGWQQHFHTYCIPEDVVPRILSPAYFQHYHEAGQEQVPVRAEPDLKKSAGNERMALGLGPVQTSLWRLSRLVPLVSAQNTLQWLKGKKKSVALAAAPPSMETKAGDDSRLVEPLEIREGTEGVSLVPLRPDDSPSTEGKSAASKQPDWRKRVLPLPSYIPFGQLYLLQKLSVEPLSASEYTRLTSVQSVLLELRDRFQSHTMKSYRTRFQKIFEHCLGPEAPSPVFMMEHLPHLPHLRQWLGVDGAGMTELRKIAGPLIIRTATSLVPLGWRGSPGEKGCEPLKVDVQGYGLHLCTLVRAQVNGRWCATKIENSPVPPTPFPVVEETGLQTMRIRIGAPLSAKPDVEEVAVDSEGVKTVNIPVEGLSQVTIQCSTDFVTSSKSVSMKLRRVRLLGLEGAGKTSLYYALMGQGGGVSMNTDTDGFFPDMEWREGVSCGVGYVDAAGVNLQDLSYESEQLKNELSRADPYKSLDLVVLVHNLAHKIPRLRQQAADHSRPALGTLLDEITTADVPFVLALTNKFAVSADRRQLASVAAMDAYKSTPDLTVVVNSCPYTVHGRGGTSESLLQSNSGGDKVPGTAQRIISAPINLVQMPFRRKEEVLPVEGVKNLRALVHRVLLTREEAAFEELQRATLEEQARREVPQQRIGFVHGKSGNGTAAALGAALGAGFGVVVAIVVGASAALGKP
ncbi:hypothetical protein SELMODRAFT_20285, partial [Selaginella moellendorffii]